MKRYVAILRGINVGGKHKVKMEDLRGLLNNLGLNDVQTYIQSGNIIFNSSKSSIPSLIESIEKCLYSYYQFRIPCLVLSANEVAEALNNNPFLKDQQDITKLHCTFLREVPGEINIASIDVSQFEPDSFQIIGKIVYVHCPNGYGRTKLTNTFFEKKLKVEATTRNWKTTLKLHELSN